MKKYLLFAFLGMALCSGFTSCGDDDDDDEISKPSASLTVSPHPLNFTSYSAGSKTITVNSTSSWHANKIGAFISLNPSTGKSGTTKVKVSVTKTSAYRNGKIMFHNNEGKSFNVIVYQRKN